MTEKDNFLLLLNGEHPEWVPIYSLGPSPDGSPPPTSMTSPSFLNEGMRKPGISKDIWGVEYIPVADAGGAKIPDTTHFILDDITKWRDVIKAPDLSGIDWEMMAKKDLARFPYDRKDTLMAFTLHQGYFQFLAEFMGFAEGMMAMYEEPEEVQALIQYLSDFYYEIAVHTLDLYKPDILDLCDDIATAQNPFFSLDMYREIFKPAYVRLANLAKDRGMYVSMHCCGHCDIFVDDWYQDLYVRAWNPAQSTNDLMAVKEKYNNSLIICGGWDAQANIDNLNTEEEIKESVIAAIDKFAPGGGYAFCGHFLGAIGDEKIAQKNRWINEAAAPYCKSFYKTHGA